MCIRDRFKPINTSNIGSLEGQLSGGGSGARVPILISDDEAHSAEVKKVVAGEINSTIPVSYTHLDVCKRQVLY